MNFKLEDEKIKVLGIGFLDRVNINREIGLVWRKYRRRYIFKFLLCEF